jgi:hypothetical protein
VSKRDEAKVREALADPASQPLSLARELAEQARSPFDEASVLAVADPDPRVATYARVVLSYGVELALRSMMERAPADGGAVDARARVQLLKAVVAGEAHLRERVVAWLLGLLSDETVVPVPALPTEEPLVPRRVKDHAFWALRALAHPDEDMLERLVDERLFDHLPLAQKDALVAEAASKQAFRPPREAYLPPEQP